MLNHQVIYLAPIYYFLKGIKKNFECRVGGCEPWKEAVWMDSINVESMAVWNYHTEPSNLYNKHVNNKNYNDTFL